VTGADAGLATTPEELAAPATAAAVLLAASNKARTRSAMAASLSPIFSIVLKISPVRFRSRKNFKNAEEKPCVNGSQKFTVRGRKIYTNICGFYVMLTGGFS
jgi:hypothetical protein